MKNKLFILFLFLSLPLLQGCATDNEPPTQIPYVYVDIEINLLDLRYLPLQDRGWMYLNGGVKGLLVVRESASTYRAFERTCPYQPENACAIVEMHSTGFYIFDDCCSSQFDKFGNVTQGPAKQPLLQYNTYQNGNYLVIRN